MTERTSEPPHNRPDEAPEGFREQPRYAPTVERAYANDRVEVTWEPAFCIHVAECVRGLPAVFDNQRRPWIIVENGSPDDIIAVDAGSRSRKSAYAVLDTVVDQQRAPLETSTVMEAKLHAVVPVSVPRKRPRRITFTVSPFSCSLGDSPEEEKLKRYLRPWGIEHEQCA